MLERSTWEYLGCECDLELSSLASSGIPENVNRSGGKWPQDTVLCRENNDTVYISQEPEEGLGILTSQRLRHLDYWELPAHACDIQSGPPIREPRHCLEHRAAQSLSF